MDPFKLLSRSTKLSKRTLSTSQRETPSSWQHGSPHLFQGGLTLELASRKRKRGEGATTETPPDLSEHPAQKRKHHQKPAQALTVATDFKSFKDNLPVASGLDDRPLRADLAAAVCEESKAILRKHKVKVTWLNPPQTREVNVRKRPKSKEAASRKPQKQSLTPRPLQSFTELRTRVSASATLAENVDQEGYTTPTEVQLAAIPLLMKPYAHSDSISESMPGDVDLLSVAPTGSGKTLAFMIPLLHCLIQGKCERRVDGRTVSAIILAPTKELASQIVNEGRKLARNTGVQVTQARKGMELASPARKGAHHEGSVRETKSDQPATVVKADVLVSTPGTLESIVVDARKVEATVLHHVHSLILDEADVLLDPLFREQTLSIWNNLTNEDLRVSLWSATMGSNIEELALSVIDERRERLQAQISRQLKDAPLIRIVVGLKDSAVPNIEHRLVYAASEQGKLMGLRQLLSPTTSTAESRSPLLPPFLIFTQTIERAIALHSELLYDIPAEAGGISRIAVLHSDLSDTARDSVMTRFRKGDVWILITTDLLSRGVDFRGVNGVVNYDIPTSSAAYVHRVGRTGRAGREGGIAVTFYTKEDIPYLKSIANLVAMAEKSKGAGEVGGVQKWLLDALPTLNKNAKQSLKKHGIESRTMRGMRKDPKAASKSRISTKSGYVRREENKRKGAILGSRRRRDAVSSDDGEQSDFGGFD